MENRHGETPLMLAVIKGREAEFDRLLKLGASVTRPAWLDAAPLRRHRRPHLHDEAPHRTRCRRQRPDEGGHHRARHGRKGNRAARPSRSLHAQAPTATTAPTGHVRRRLRQKGGRRGARPGTSPSRPAAPSRAPPGQLYRQPPASRSRRDARPLMQATGRTPAQLSTTIEDSFVSHASSPHRS